MDIAAEIIGIRPLRTKLIAFAVSSYIIGVAGALWLFLVQGNLEADAFDILTMSFPILFMIIVGGLGTVMGSIFGACFLVMTPVLIKNFPEAASAVPSDRPGLRRVRIHGEVRQVALGSGAHCPGTCGLGPDTGPSVVHGGGIWC